MEWHIHGKTMRLDRPRIVGILNVTPDSYVDGGMYRTPEAIGERARVMVREGADIIEIGGESTGPGSKDVSAEEECARVLPAVEVIKRSVPDTWICVDTWKADVARAAVEAGAHMINDVTAGRADTAMLSTLAELGCPVVLMHAKDDSPRTTVSSTSYDDVIAHIRAFLLSRIAEAEKAGVRRENIVVDPGLGHFVSSDPRYSFEILDRLSELTDLGPVLVSPSRKSFLAGPENLPVADRLPATLAATETAFTNGALFIRTHDVAATHALLPA